MTEASPETPDVTAAVRALRPQLQRTSMTALLSMVGISIVTALIVLIAVNGINDGEDRFKVVLFVGLIGLLLILAALGWMRRAQESLVMPIVAQAVGLTYRKDAKPFLNALPERLLPRASVRKAEDLVHGRMGTYSVQMAEVKIETGGKNSRTLFKGVVAQFPNSIAMPAFFLAPHEQTRPGMIFKAWIPTDGLYHLKDVTGPTGKTYGVWVSSSTREEPAALSAVVEILTTLESRMGAPMQLFTATSNGEEMHIALTHIHDLFRVGGFFQPESRLFQDIETATRDLALPLTLVKELVAAEVAAAEKAKGA